METPFHMQLNGSRISQKLPWWWQWPIDPGWLLVRITEQQTSGASFNSGSWWPGCLAPSFPIEVQSLGFVSWKCISRQIKNIFAFQTMSSCAFFPTICVGKTRENKFRIASGTDIFSWRNGKSPAKICCVCVGKFRFCMQLQTEQNMVDRNIKQQTGKLNNWQSVPELKKWVGDASAHSLLVHMDGYRWHLQDKSCLSWNLNDSGFLSDFTPRNQTNGANFLQVLGVYAPISLACWAEWMSPQCQKRQVSCVPDCLLSVVWENNECQVFPRSNMTKLLCK